MKIPPEILVSLRQGTVYYMQHRDITSPLSHLCIVMNPNPCKEKDIILAVISSQIEKTKKAVITYNKFPEETLIEILPIEYDELKKHSIINCNDLHSITIHDLIDKIQTKQIEYKQDIPQCLITKIIKGILISPKVSNDVKNIFKE